MNVPNREINGVIFMLAGCHRNGHFVTSKYDGHEKCSMCIWVERNYILSIEGSVTAGTVEEKVHMDCVQAQSPDMKLQ